MSSSVTPAYRPSWLCAGLRFEDLSETTVADRNLLDITKRVRMMVDADIEAAYPRAWSAWVEVITRDGGKSEAFVDTPKGDPGNLLSRKELEAKVSRLATHFHACDAGEMASAIQRIWHLADASTIAGVFKTAVPDS